MNTKPKIGITIGDINGVGPEIIIKMLSDDRIYSICQPIVYGSTKVLSHYKKLMNNDKFKYAHLKDWDQLSGKQTYVVNCFDENVTIQTGIATDDAGKYALDSLDEALKDWKENKIDALVTAPINKELVAKHTTSTFKGHTEYITQFCGAEESLMLLHSDRLCIGLVTNHIAIQQIATKLKANIITQKALLLNQSLKKDFGIQRPKIAVLSLNPHAGENGLLGDEEIKIIKPAIQDANSRGVLVFGPYPSDGFFGTQDYLAFDGILAMYHDQGLIPFKTLSFEEGVNFTAGLKLVRTSPDHGTAYNIAGKNMASESSIRQALYLAIDVLNNRKSIGKE